MKRTGGYQTIGRKETPVEEMTLSTNLQVLRWSIPDSITEALSEKRKNVFDRSYFETYITQNTSKIYHNPCFDIS